MYYTTFLHVVKMFYYIFLVVIKKKLQFKGKIIIAKYLQTFVKKQSVTQSFNQKINKFINKCS